MIQIKLDSLNPYLYQWDRGQRVILDGAAPDTILYFGHCEDEGIQRIPYSENGKIYADVPDILLQKAVHIHVSVRIETGEKATTVMRTTIRIIRQEKPADYVCDDELPIWHSLEDRIAALEKGGSSSGLTITNDSEGNVAISTGGTATITSDGEGNVTIR